MKIEGKNEKKNVEKPITKTYNEQEKRSCEVMRVIGA